MISMYRLRKGPAVITTIFFTILGASLLLGNTALSSGAEGSGNFLRDLKAVVTVNGFNLTADLAITDEQKAEGLAVKDSLKENEGMLFVYEQPSDQSFWMKDMKFPIDIIWLNNNGTVVYIRHNLQPCIMTFDFLCPIYTPDKDSLYVLETVSGFSKKHSIKIGTHVDFQLIS